ncbi:MAG: TIGR01440 family protein [Clostridia bacterium]|nr:TIGR01440 family protein [Clostridia bacterium]
MTQEWKKQAAAATAEICEKAHLKKGDCLVVGCSSSEVLGHSVGSFSSPEAAEAVLDGIMQVLEPKGVFLAAQCCEHLNRALIVECEALPQAERVNVVPQPKAGGSFATAAYQRFKNPIAVEHIRADAGLDIGGTLIGMHLKEVAVPVRLAVSGIGQALLLAARTRPRFIGGNRAVYDETLL